MRSILVSLIILPAIATAQINRSAREFASEKIGEYVTAKLFKDKPYHSVSFGEIKACKEKDTEVEWSLVHDFEITESEKAFGQAKTVSKHYKFAFYLDKRMRVLRAEGAFIN